MRRFAGRLVIVLIGLGLGLGATELLLRGFAMPLIYYRPSDMLSTYDPARGHGHYQANRVVDMMVRHGDLIAIGGRGIDADPRRNVFRTDSEGFRNDHDYAGERYVLTGDSFIDGTGNSQEHLLSAAVNGACSVPVYNLAFPGAVTDYVTYVTAFQARHHARVQSILFLFEGNDFPERGPEDGPVTAPGQPDRLADFARWMRRTALLRNSVTARLAYRTYQSRHPELSANDVVAFSLGRHRFGELDGYMRASQRTSYAPPDTLDRSIASIKEMLAMIVFIPTKYRVYYPLLEASAPPLPTVHQDYVRRLGETLGVPTLDLTDPLRDEAARLFRTEDRLVFWSDDTHWNPSGIRAAARALCARLAK